MLDNIQWISSGYARYKEQNLCDKLKRKILWRGANGRAHIEHTTNSVNNFPSWKIIFTVLLTEESLWFTVKLVEFQHPEVLVQNLNQPSLICANWPHPKETGSRGASICCPSDSSTHRWKSIDTRRVIGERIKVRHQVDEWSVLTVWMILINNRKQQDRRGTSSSRKGEGKL